MRKIIKVAVLLSIYLIAHHEVKMLIELIEIAHFKSRVSRFARGGLSRNQYQDVVKTVVSFLSTVCGRLILTIKLGKALRGIIFGMS